MTNPLNTAPVDTPAIVYDVTGALAFRILPIAFLVVCIVMLFSRTKSPPYFSVFCIFGSMGALCLAVYFANSPISILGFLIAFIISPLLLVSNWIQLRARAKNSVCHRIVQWASAIPLMILAFFVLWHPTETQKNAEQGAVANPVGAVTGQVFI